jgi:SAM-dependent methyltransferase
MDSSKLTQKNEVQAHRCRACDSHIKVTAANPIYWVHSNVRVFRHQQYPIYRCLECFSITSINPVDMRHIYEFYPLKHRRLDLLAKPAFANLLRRLKKAGLQPHHRILDFGCGNGVFIQYLRSQGFTRVEGFDPYDPQFQNLPHGSFDCIFANDVIEHLDHPESFMTLCHQRLNKSGFIYIGTTCTDQIDWHHPEKQLMLLHQPYHRFIFSRRQFQNFAENQGFQIRTSYQRSYMDTLIPFANYCFLDELNKSLNHEMDRAFEPISPWLFLLRPKLLLAAFWGYFYPPTAEPALVLTRPNE